MFGSMAPRRPPATRRWLTAATWPVGIALTSWDYMWRTTVLRRAESEAPFPDPAPESLRYPSGLPADDVQGYESGYGPLFHRTYRTRIRGSGLGAEELTERIRRGLDRAAPRAFARFQLTQGEPGRPAVGDEYVVRMPGPWDGPVRVVAADPRSFRLATLTGHLEAGQIEFRARPGEEALVFEIESWARSKDRLVHLLYHRLRMAKEVQAHMWISFLERVVGLAEGRMAGGIEIRTERIALPDTAGADPAGCRDAPRSGDERDHSPSRDGGGRS
jgi:hypothetical protein